VFVGLFLLGRLGAVEAGLGFAIVAGVAVFVPRGGNLESRDTGEHRNDQLLDQLIRGFGDALAEPCFILDRRAVVMHRNEAAERYFATSHVGDPLAFSLRNPALISAIDNVHRCARPQSIEFHQTVPNDLWFRVSVAAMNVNEEHFVSVPLAFTVVTFYNLTEQKRTEQMRADFIANVSHELRTPLTSLLGFIDTLVGPAAKDAAARERFLGIMRTHAERMSVLIDDLLSLSRIEMRQHVRPTGRVNVASLLGEVVEGLQMQAQEAGVKVNLKLPRSAAEVTGEREELYEVFENLVDNAIKYGADGGRIDIELAQVSGRPGYEYAVNVTDYGVGIEQEHVPRLTERFYRVDAESSRKKKGTGLGLAIVKHIVNRHRGRLVVKSELGAGSTFTVRLPARPQAAVTG
jgi:two-component system phosphate regulon sensor histidine kinase PhoR